MATKTVEKTADKRINSLEKKTLLFSDDDFDVEIYNQIALKAQLVDISLLASTFAVKPECLGEFDNPEFDHDHSFDGYPQKFSFDPEKGVAIGTIAWISEIKSGRKKALKLSAEYLAIYAGLQNMDIDYVRLYFGKVAKFATYPYFRTLFSVQTSSAGLRFSPLPSLIDRVD